MAEITNHIIRQLKESDIQGLNSLPPLDWKFDYESFLRDFIDDDFFFAFVMVHDYRIIGTGNVLLQDKIGWYANIIIDTQYRGKGLGFKMTSFLVNFLSNKGCETHLLLATKLGEFVYQKLEFRKVTEYLCFDSVVDSDHVNSESICNLKESDLNDVYLLDQEANGENRRHLIDKYYKNGIGYFNDKNELLGCYLPDFGRGLVLAKEEAIGIELLKIKHSLKGRRTMLPAENHSGVEFFLENGFKKGESISRMILGKEKAWNPQFIYSYGSGYCG